MNNFREWLSDNLRYILLFLGIAAALVLLFFGVRLLTRAYADRNGDQDFSADSVLDTSEVPEEEKEAAPTPEVTETATPSPAAVKAAGPTGGELEINAHPEVNALITSYYAALETKDPEAVRAVVDSLSDEDAAKVSEAASTSYTDIDVYTKKGEAEGTYLVYACYRYLTEGNAAALPGLSQLFVRTEDNGDLRIVTTELSEATQDYIDEVNGGADIKALVERVQTEYDSALAEAETASGATGSEDAAAADAAAKAAEEQAAAEKAAAEQAAAQAEAEAAAKAEAERKAAEEAAAQAAYEAEHRETPAHTLSTCNVRSGPGYEYGVIFADLPGGSGVTVIGDTEAGWRHIRVTVADGTTYDGYVGGRFIAY